MLHTLLRRASVAALASSTLLAQGFLPVGSQIMDGSQNMVTVNLGFNFTMPGGTVVSSVDVDEYGRIVEVGTDASDANELTSTMTANPTSSIMALWDTITYPAGAGVFFDTDNSTRAVITWQDVSSPSTCTFQLQLYSDGRIIMVYDDRCPQDDGIIGFCPGNGAVLPAPTDLSTIPNGTPLVTSDATVFEDFGNTSTTWFDFPGAYIEFIPQNPGGTIGWIATGGFLPFAVNFDSVQSGCPAVFTPTSYTFTPDGLGNYDIVAGASVFDPNIGPSLGFTVDDTKQTNFNIGFPFPWASGPDTLIDIDPNGRILPSNSTDAGDYTPTPAEHDDAESIAVFWIDFNVNEPGSGNVHLNTVPGVSATITWNNVKQFDPSNSVVGMTVQVQMFPNGSFVITHEDIGAFNDEVIGASRRDLLVGCSDGSGVDPGEIDLTALPVNVPIGVNYEWWDSSATATVPAVEPTDLLFIGGRLVALSEPLAGTLWRMQVQGIGPAFFGLYIVSTTQIAQDLSAFGTPCNLLVTPELILTALPDGLGNLTEWQYPLPATPAINGLEFFLQGAVAIAPDGPYTGFAGLPWGLVFTNSIGGRIGDT